MSTAGADPYGATFHLCIILPLPLEVTEAENDLEELDQLIRREGCSLFQVGVSFQAMSDALNGRVSRSLWVKCCDVTGYQYVAFWYDEILDYIFQVHEIAYVVFCVSCNLQEDGGHVLR